VLGLYNFLLNNCSFHIIDGVLLGVERTFTKLKLVGCLIFCAGANAHRGLDEGELVELLGEFPGAFLVALTYVFITYRGGLSVVFCYLGKELITVILLKHIGVRIWRKATRAGLTYLIWRAHFNGGHEGACVGMHARLANKLRHCGERDCGTKHSVLIVMIN
jgi:hypothetical protein